VKAGYKAGLTTLLHQWHLFAGLPPTHSQAFSVQFSDIFKDSKTLLLPGS